MKIWLKDKTSTPLTYTYCSSLQELQQMIAMKASTDDPIELISMPADEESMEFLKTYDDKPRLFKVAIRGTMNEETQRMILKNHLDKPPLPPRTAEIIMVLKGQSNLQDDIPKNLINIGTYLQDVALYISDVTTNSFNMYIQNPNSIERFIQQAVIDYLAACDTPNLLLYDYFEHKRMFSSIYTDTQCWCAALANTKVKNSGTYINGFNQYNTKPYQRRNPFMP